jgi:1-aminocyclopropane-1-carboxylate deaminase
MIQTGMQIPSPIQVLQMPLLEDLGIKLSIKREDLIHPTVSGNKWRKLQYNIDKVIKEGYQGIVTFGGAFSNHIYSTAAACQLLDIPSVGIIRGEEDVKNPTLEFAKKCGMTLHFIDRGAYRLKDKSPSVQKILANYPNYLLVPEGGSNALGLKGCYAIGQEINTQLESSPDYVVVSAGTGCTAAGIIQSTSVKKEILVNSALKGDFLKDAIQGFLKDGCSKWRLLTDYHFGGYGRANSELIRFINQWGTKHEVLLDPIYNGKSFFALMDLIQKGHFERGDHILYVHTGGLQGIMGWNYRNPNLQIA